MLFMVAICIDREWLIVVYLCCHHVHSLMLYERPVSFTQGQTSCSSHPSILAEVGAEEQEGREKREPKEKKRKKKERTRLNCCRCRSMIHHQHSSFFAICRFQW
ncbi:hypothetical protein F5H01DRAFT_354984 [Linnemannia elongata]|nr:hypothetical protein F5H01DRAFT_354984 [Linnemannia elongata]